MSVFKIKEMMRFTPSDLKKFGEDITQTHIKQIKKGIDADGEGFEGYTEPYRTRKSAGTAAKNQASKQVQPPDLTLTGAMLKEFKFINSSVSEELSIDYGIKNAQQAKKMNALRLGRFGKPSKRGRVTIRKDKARVVAKNQKLGPEVEERIAFNFAKNIEKNLRRLTNRPTIIQM